MLILLFCCILLQNNFAQKMIVTDTSGLANQYVLSGTKLTFVGDTIINIIKPDGNISENISNIREITFINVSAIDPTSIEELNMDANMLKIYPNPAADMVNISYKLQTSSPVEISIYDITGMLVKQIDLGTQQAGDYKYIMNTNDMLSNGTYFCQVKMDNEILKQRIIIIK